MYHFVFLERCHGDIVTDPQVFLMDYCRSSQRTIFSTQRAACSRRPGPLK